MKEPLAKLQTCVSVVRAVCAALCARPRQSPALDRAHH